jgi:hypothetical protein
MLDSQPAAIVKRLGRRDDFPGDWIEVNIDGYHDLRSGYSFTLSASGVRATRPYPTMAITGTANGTRAGQRTLLPQMKPPPARINTCVST